MLPTVAGAKLQTDDARVDDQRVNDACEGENVTYTVQPGDRLFTIGEQYGSGFFWEAIYITNAENIRNPHFIYPGQQLVIPHHVAHFSESSKSVVEILEQPLCEEKEAEHVAWERVDFDYLYVFDRERLEIHFPDVLLALQDDTNHPDMVEKAGTDVDTTDRQVDEDTLKAFREAFDALVEYEQEERHREEEQAVTERQMFVEIDGMIHDETRSKIGRDFYDIFYASWQSPPEASNYSIRITEQPAPNLGTVIAVQVNNTETFRTRLQPRYDVIEEASHFAVRRTYMFLQQNQQQFMIY